MITQTNPNGSLTDRLFGILGGVVDTAATAYTSKVTGTSTPAPTAAPRVADPAPSLPAQAQATGANTFAVTPQMMLAAGGALVGVIVLAIVLKRK